VNKKSASSARSNPGWFRKGRSGNPGGRPTASPTSRGSVFDIVVEKTLTVTHHGGTREITMEEALQQRTYRDAVAGQRMAQREVVKWILKREAWLASIRQKRLGGRSSDTFPPIRIMRMQLSCFWGSRRAIPRALTLALSARNSSWSLGLWRQRSAAGAAVVA
jgi:hypothetical protein